MRTVTGQLWISLHGPTLHWRGNRTLLAGACVPPLLRLAGKMSLIFLSFVACTSELRFLPCSTLLLSALLLEGMVALELDAPSC